MLEQSTAAGASVTNANPNQESPRNGLAGLKHWRHDIVAGLLVSLISLPLSLGIAVASGAPPVCGLISAIIAGLVMPFLGGTYVTISGPAAGLAPALLAAMVLLGRGDLQAGYPLLLAVISITGCVQIVLSFFKAARFSAMFPSAVIEGMLASIGLLIVAKQLPNFIGHPYHAHEFFGIIAETPAELMLMTPRVFLLGAICLVLLFLLSSNKARRLQVVPPPLTVVLVGISLGYLLGIDANHLIHVPDNLFEHGIHLPDFQGVFTDHTLWMAVATTVITLTLIDGVESLATAAAIDRIDPFKRKSQPNRTLFAMGVSNICSSMLGGLTIIPGGVKSKVCIMNGGRTLWANFYNAIFLLIYLFAATRLINMIPLAALAAILIHTGYKMCEPRLWKHIAHIGREQLFIFSATVLATLYTDLLWGIVVGMLVKLLLHVSLTWPAKDNISDEPVRLGSGIWGTLQRISCLFRNPVGRRELLDGTYTMYVDKPLVCFNWQHMSRELSNIPSEATSVCVCITPSVALVDHTTCDHLIAFAREFQNQGRGTMEIDGLAQMWARSDYASSMRHGSPEATVSRRVARSARRLLRVVEPVYSPRRARARRAAEVLSNGTNGAAHTSDPSQPDEEELVAESVATGSGPANGAA